MRDCLRLQGFWEDCLFLLTSDNGGPSYNSAHTANNYPLRGSKLSDWEGGVRVTAFVSGGWVPTAEHGTTRHGLMAIADWHATFCELAGAPHCNIDAAAAAANLPPLDSISMVDCEFEFARKLSLLVITGPIKLWRAFAVAKGAGSDRLLVSIDLRGDEPFSPRLEVQVDSNVLRQSTRNLRALYVASRYAMDIIFAERLLVLTVKAESNCTSGLAPCKIWKILSGYFPSTPQGATGWACFPGPHYPNGTDPSCHSGGNCDKELGGCLFELISDPTVSSEAI